METNDCTKPSPWVRAAQVATVVVVTVLSVGVLAVTAVAVSLCGLFGEQCSSSEEMAISVTFVGAVVAVCAGLVVAVVVATRQYSWRNVANMCAVLAGASVLLAALSWSVLP